MARNITTARPVYLTLSEAGDTLGVSTDTIRRRIADGTIAGYRIARRVKVRQDDLDKLVTRIPSAVQ